MSAELPHSAEVDEELFEAGVEGELDLLRWRSSTAPHAAHVHDVGRNYDQRRVHQIDGNQEPEENTA